MISETTHSDQYNRLEGCLYLAFELSQKQWKLGFTIGIAQRPRIRNIMVTRQRKHNLVILGG